MEGQRRPVKERRRPGPLVDEDAPVTCLSVLMRVGGELEGREMVTGVGAVREGAK